uniref:Uncharacterized protein n=1 Tax=Bionectria ochroleuca TaxID=29856 RepID=A0A0B7JRT4_BIOOC
MTLASASRSALLRGCRSDPSQEDNQVRADIPIAGYSSSQTYPSRARREDRQAEEAKVENAKKQYKKQYNSLAWRWTTGIIAMPILLVTSYYLFDRLALGHEQKTVPNLDSPRSNDNEKKSGEKPE